jgi:hypothetical protein
VYIGDKEMFDYFHKPLRYKEFDGLTDSDQPIFKPETTVLGLRVKGQTKVIHGEDGDAVTCTIVYRTAEPLVPKSFIEGHEIMESVPINAMMLSTGFLNYVK